MFFLILFAEFLGAAFGELIAIIGNEGEALRLSHSEESTIGSAIMVEIIMTFILTLIIHIVKDKTAVPTDMGIAKAFTVGLTLTACIYCGGRLSGAAMNQAVGTFLLIGKAIVSNEPEHAEHFYIYLIGPTVGGILSALYMRFLHAPQFAYFEDEP